jgi:ATP dependent DNA ligase domain
MLRTLPAGFIAPCLPTKTDTLPSDSQWLHEIKHDGFRVVARKDGPRVRLYSRPGNDLTYRFPLIAEALKRETEEERGKKGGDEYAQEDNSRTDRQKRKSRPMGKCALAAL